MSRINVNELLTDPDFAGPLTIIKRVADVNGSGENILLESTVCTVGVIQPATADTLKRLPDGAQLSKIITVFTKSQLTANVAGRYADQVFYQGKRHNVITCMPWAEFGGWFMCDCELEVASL